MQLRWTEDERAASVMKREADHLDGIVDVLRGVQAVLRTTSAVGEVAYRASDQAQMLRVTVEGFAAELRARAEHLAVEAARQVREDAETAVAEARA